MYLVLLCEKMTQIGNCGYEIEDKQTFLLMKNIQLFRFGKASEKDTAKNGYYFRMLDVIKRIMSIALKDNEFLQFTVITGCLHIHDVAKLVYATDF